MKILVLGNGLLANSIVTSALSCGYKAQAISTRGGLNLCQIESLSDCDIVIDTMDLPHDNHDEFWSLQNRLTLIRNQFSHCSFSGKFCYISSINLYKLSITSIDEASQLSPRDDIKKSAYLLNKINTEELLSSLFSGRFLIFRLVNLWTEVPDPSRNSFFSDLIYARSIGKTLAPRNGDKEVISFMNYTDAAALILKTLGFVSDEVSVCNISASIWSSREHLKTSSLADDVPLALGRRITSMHYKPELLNYTFAQLP